MSRYATDNTYIGFTVRNLDTTTVYFYGSVQLPHGATVTNVTSYWYDVDTSLDIFCDLLRTTGEGIGHVMANVYSSGSAGYGSTVDTSIDFDPIIDNSLWSYCLYVEIPANSPTTNLRLRFVTIGFAYPT